MGNPQDGSMLDTFTTQTPEKRRESRPENGGQSHDQKARSELIKTIKRENIDVNDYYL